MVPVRPSGGDAFVGKCSKTLFTVIVFRLGEPVPRLETYGAFLRGSCGRGMRWRQGGYLSQLNLEGLYNDPHSGCAIDRALLGAKRITVER